MAEEQISRSFDSKVRRGLFRPVARYLARNPEAEDRMQEGVASAWLTFHRLSRAGEVPDDALLVHHCRLRACDSARHLVSYHTPAKNNDAMSHCAYAKGRVAGVLHLDSLEDGLSQVLCANPSRKIISVIDLGTWLGGLADVDREMVTARVVGEELSAIAKTHGVSVPTACRRLRQLGHELAERAAVTVNSSTRQRGRP